MPASRRSRPAPADRLQGARDIALLAFEGLSPFHFSVPLLVFGEDRREIGAPRFDVTVCAEQRRPVDCGKGFSVTPSATLARIDRASIVIIPSWNMARMPSASLLRALQRAHARGATLVGLCLGAFVLAEAGLLDGRRATTHWHWAGAFQGRYPAVRLDPQVLYVDDGDGVITSAGTAAGLDCCLHLLRRICGSEVANRVARRIVVAPHRSGGQAQFIEEPLPRSPVGERLSATLDWAAAHLAEPLSIDMLAGRAALSRRTFTRQFQKATGMSMLNWLVQRRLAAARRMLEGGTESVEAVAAAVGFGSAASMRLHFTRAYGISPQAFRRQFVGGPLAETRNATGE